VVPPFVAPVTTVYRLWYRASLWISATPSPSSAVGHGILGSWPEMKSSRHSMEFFMSYFKHYQTKGFCELRLGTEIFYLVGNKDIAEYLIQNEKLFPQKSCFDEWHLFSKTSQSSIRPGMHLLGRAAWNQ